jgi:putative ABC transport system permease protein
VWLEYLRIAQKVLRAHKFRSTLTVLSITIGAFSIVVMSSLADSGLKTLAKGIEDLGGGKLILLTAKQVERAEGKEKNYTHGITPKDAEVLFSSLPHVEAHSLYEPMWRADVIADNGLASRTDFVGGDGTFLDMFKMHLQRGRGFTQEENQQHAKVCIAGHKLAEKLFDGDAIGHWMTIGGVHCRVIGQLANQDRWGVHMGFDWLDLGVVPIEVLKEVVPEAREGMMAVFRTDGQRSNEAVKRIVNALIADRHHGVDDFEIVDFARFMDKFNALFDTMKAIVGLLAGIALLVGGIGVMNMMLVSVSERVREIGIRKAIGASPRDIAAQFLWEAIVLAGSGGAIGVAAGVGTAVGAGRLIKHWRPLWVSTVSHNAVVTALIVSAGIGVMFGFFPARRASRLSAIEAIRR